MTKLLLLCGAVAGPLFVAIFLIEGATRPGYDPASMAVSLLSFGNLGWQQQANFIINGLLLVTFAVGLGRVVGKHHTGSRAGAGLVGMIGLGVLVLGLFIGDPGEGYPPGVPAPSEPSMSGTIHDSVSLVVFLLGSPGSCLTFAAAFARQGARRWAAYSAASGALALGGIVLLIAAFGAGGQLLAMAGVIERGTIVLWYAWLTPLAIHMLRVSATGTTPPGPRPA